MALHKLTNLFLGQYVSPVIRTCANKVDGQSQVLHILSDPTVWGDQSGSVCGNPVIHDDHTVLQSNHTLKLHLPLKPPANLPPTLILTAHAPGIRNSSRVGAAALMTLKRS